MLASFHLLMCFELLLFFFHLPLLLDERILIGDVNTSEPVSALSARTRRVDPLNSFKKYKGGYNITSTHYWSFWVSELISLRQPRLYKIFYLSMQNILDGYPGIERLANCQLVKDASKILLKECKPLRNYAYSTWAASVVLSIFMVFFVLMLIVEAHQQHKRLTSHCSVVQPQPGLEGSQMDMIAL
ncbi:hypothetical protein GW17_00034014 [Ensete ventricosum]|nr:hypothetical protein GW17_00034014 [Ensete ventricosum]